MLRYFLNAFTNCFIFFSFSAQIIMSSPYSTEPIFICFKICISIPLFPDLFLSITSPTFPHIFSSNLFNCLFPSTSFLISFIQLCNYSYQFFQLFPLQILLLLILFPLLICISYVLSILYNSVLLSQVTILNNGKK